MNSTVNCRRSASAGVGRDCAIGGEAARRGAFRVSVVLCSLRRLAAGCCPSTAKGVPHSAQNLAWGRLLNPQLWQERVTALPHSIQNFAPSGFSNVQLGQCMALVYCIRRAGARKRLNLCLSLPSNIAHEDRSLCLEKNELPVSLLSRRDGSYLRVRLVTLLVRCSCPFLFLFCNATHSSVRYGSHMVTPLSVTRNAYTTWRDSGASPWNTVEKLTF